jgi:hypothetical protein
VVSTVGRLTPSWAYDISPTLEDFQLPLYFWL